MVSRDTVHARTREPCTPEDVATADHQRHLHAESEQFLDLERDATQHDGIDAVIGIPHQRLTGDFHEDALVMQFAVRHLWRLLTGAVHL